MFTLVLAGIRKQFQVIDFVILGIAVAMVDDFLWGEESTQMLLHD